jgi:hypothetical protein
MAYAVATSPSLTDEITDRRITRWSRRGGEELAVVEVADDLAAAPSDSDLSLGKYEVPKLLPEDSHVDAGEMPREKLVPLQSWEGTVLGVDDESFLVRLVDATGHHADEEISLSTEELCDFDLELLEPGAILYWTVGYSYKGKWRS